MRKSWREQLIGRRTLVLGILLLLVQFAVLAALLPIMPSEIEIVWIASVSAFGVLLQLIVVRFVALPQETENAGAPLTPEDEGKAHLALALGVSHEIRQPLFIIQLATRNALAQITGANPDQEALEHALTRIAMQADKATAIVGHTLDLARSQPRRPERVELVSMIEACIADWQVTLPADSITVVFKADATGSAGCHVTVDPVGLSQVVANALDNAAESIAQRQETGWPGQGRVDIDLASGTGSIVCRIRDNGAGVDPRTCRRAFEPFYSTKTNKVGGLGLFLSRKIVAHAGGSIDLVPAAEGAVLTLTLPAA